MSTSGETDRSSCSERDMETRASLSQPFLLRGLEVLMTSSALRHCRKTRDLRNTLLGMRIVPEPSIFLIDVRRAFLYLILNLPSTARPY